MKQLLEYLAKEWGVVSKAPFTFAILAVLMCALAYLATTWLYKGILSHKDSEITLLKAERDDYREKLGGATPNQAKARMDTLEARIQQIEPRRLTQEQQIILATKMKLPSDTTYKVEIIPDVACPDCNQYASNINTAIQRIQNWQVYEPKVVARIDKSQTGIVITVADPIHPPLGAIILMQGLTSAAVDFELSPTPTPSRNGVDVTILVTAKSIP